MIILDASFIVKLVLQEENSSQTRGLLRKWVLEGEHFATVDLALPEALNAIWKHANGIGDISREEAIQAAEDLLKIWKKLKQYQSMSIAEEALNLALDEGITVYDALYLQLAKTGGGKLAAYDREMRKIAKKHGIMTYP